ncbi:unnamed protein product [Choristocarpus tenellus]
MRSTTRLALTALACAVSFSRSYASSTKCLPFMTCTNREQVWEAGLVTAIRCRGGGDCPSKLGRQALSERRREGYPMMERKGMRWWGGGSARKVTVTRGGSLAVAPVDKAAYRKALLRTCLVFFSAVAFGLGTMVVKGKQSGMEFFTGYLVEQSLSVDNLFVFILLFEYFKVPPQFQVRYNRSIGRTHSFFLAAVLLWRSQSSLVRHTMSDNFFFRDCSGVSSFCPVAMDV